MRQQTAASATALLLGLSQLARAATPSVPQAGGLDLVDPLPAGVRVDAEATGLSDLIRRTHPLATFDHDNMIWVGRDTRGVLFFSVGHAVTIRDAHGNPHAAMISSDTPVPRLASKFLSGTTGICDSATSNQTAATGEVSQSVRAFCLGFKPERGAFYQINWYSNGDDQAEHRTLIVRRDANGYWRWVGEVPPVSEAVSHVGAIRTTVDCAVHWAATPWISVHVVQKMTAFGIDQSTGRDDLSLCVDGQFAHEFQWCNEPYVLADGKTTLGEIARRLLLWTGDASSVVAGPKQKEQLWSLQSAMVRLNPDLPDVAPAQTRIGIPASEESTEAAAE